MAPNRLFIDPESNDLDLDVDRLLFEAKPIALILLVFGGVGVGFFVLARLFQYVPLFPQLFLFAQQFAFALGGFVALLYVLVRATQFAGGNGLEVGSASSPSSPSDTSSADGASSRSRYEIPVTDRSPTADSDRPTSTEASDEDSSDDALDGDDGVASSADDDRVDDSDGDDGASVLDDDDETDFVGGNDDTDTDRR